MDYSLLPMPFILDNSILLIVMNFFRDLDLPDAYDIYQDTKNLIAGAPAPGVEVHCLHGEGVKTIEK